MRNAVLVYLYKTHFTMNCKHAFYLFFIALFLTNCTTDELPEKKDAIQDDPAVLAIQAEVDAAIAELQNDDEAPSNGISNRGYVFVPGGTGNRLADAVAEAGPFGTVVLGAGMHYEHNPVTINSTVTIKGEDGAVLKLTSSGPVPPDQTPYDLTPGLHIRNRAFVKIANLSIQPMGYAAQGGLAILFDNAPNASVYDTAQLPDEAIRVPIGKALTNVKIQVLNRNRQALPIGAVGERYFDGQLCRGPLRRCYHKLIPTSILSWVVLTDNLTHE